MLHYITWAEAFRFNQESKRFEFTEVAKAMARHEIYAITATADANYPLDWKTEGLHWLPALAPSKALLFRWHKLQAEAWDMRRGQDCNFYDNALCASYIKELQNSQEARAWLNDIYLSSKTEEIYLLGAKDDNESIYMRALISIFYHAGANLNPELLTPGRKMDYIYYWTK